MTGHIAVYITVPSPEDGENIASALVKKRLAACVNIVPGLRSIYRWEGEVCDDNELLLIAKTRDSMFEKLEDEVKSMHPYKVPEIVAIPIIKGSKEYLLWIDDNTTVDPLY